MVIFSLFNGKWVTNWGSKMPTLIALDVSLSMTRAVPVATNNPNDENITYNQLAIQGINEFLNYLTKNSKLEHVALVSINEILFFGPFILVHLFARWTCLAHLTIWPFDHFYEKCASIFMAFVPRFQNDIHKSYDKFIIMKISADNNGKISLQKKWNHMNSASYTLLFKWISAYSGWSSDLQIYCV